MVYMQKIKIPGKNKLINILLSVKYFFNSFLIIVQILFNEIKIEAQMSSIMGVLYLGVFSTTVAFLLQTVCQKDVSETKSAIILSLESVFGTILSVIILHEVLTIRMVIGCLVIFSAIIISETKLSFLKRDIKNKQKAESIK